MRSRLQTFVFSCVFLAMLSLILPSVAYAGSSICDAVPGNLVLNCGFETGDTTHWTVTNPHSGYDVVVGSPVNSGSFAFRIANDNYQGAAEISQTITDIPGQSYAFTFFVANGGGGSGVVDFQAFFDGGTALLHLSNVLAFPYTKYTFDVTGTGSDTISFFSINDPSYFYLDDVSLSPTGAPDPSSILLLGINLLGAAVIGLGLKLRKYGAPFARAVTVS
jgi:hypothetical protein